MELWHLTPEAGRFPAHPSAGENVNLRIASRPVELGQQVALDVRRIGSDEPSRRLYAQWERNEQDSSFWYVDLGAFREGERIAYEFVATGPSGSIRLGPFEFLVGPKIHLALLWHQHQPLYRDLGKESLRGAYALPWVRLHGLRDYYAMAAILADHPRVHATINLTPVLLAQIEDYAERGATDQALELTLVPAGRLSRAQREAVLSSFFDADWHRQIYPFPRYRELLDQRRRGVRFSAADLRDLQMWFNLAWFAPEFQEGTVALPGGSTASVERFVGKGAGFSQADLGAMVEEQRKVLRAVVAIHRELQERGQIEISTSPHAHPILPLLMDTEIAGPENGAVPRFRRPEDAGLQVGRAVESYRRWFGRSPRGMWPSEGAVSQGIVGLFAGHGVEWIATDRDILRRSGGASLPVEDPNVLAQPYRAEDEHGRGVAVFFRDTSLSNRIGFQSGGDRSAESGAREFVRELKERFAWRVADPSQRVVTVALDGENAWSSFPGQGRPFLRALYTALATDPEIKTVTFSEYLNGDPARGVLAHPVPSLPLIQPLAAGSWIDEQGSPPGTDFGTWIGEPEENRAWELLAAARDRIDAANVGSAERQRALEAAYYAEGSDWFWWFGTDQDSSSDAEFDDLFRLHLSNVYRFIGAEIPNELTQPIVPHPAIWTFAQPVKAIRRGQPLVVRMHCPGQLTWRTDVSASANEATVSRDGGALLGVYRFGVRVEPVEVGARVVSFEFHCSHEACDSPGPCCRAGVQRIDIRP